MTYTYKKVFSYLLAATLMLPVAAFAELRGLSDEAMSEAAGQAGVTIGLDMVINKAGNNKAGEKQCVENSGDCQFGLKFDNQHDENLWLTMTGVSGGINIPKTTLSSVDEKTTDGTAKPALNVGFDNTGDNKVVFTDFGFDSLRLSKDSATEEGYRTSVGFGTGVDAGRQAGFLGMRIHGSAELSGKLMIFDHSTHP